MILLFFKSEFNILFIHNAQSTSDNIQLGKVFVNRSFNGAYRESLLTYRLHKRKQNCQ